MYICHCRAVTDQGLRAALADGARDPVDLGRRCGAGTGCGGCLPALQALLAECGLEPEGGRRLVDHRAA